MNNYRVTFTDGYTLNIKATNDSDARFKACVMAQKTISHIQSCVDMGLSN